MRVLGTPCRAAQVSSVITFFLNVLLRIIALTIKWKRRPTPADELANHFHALDCGDKAKFAARRNRHVGNMLTDGMRNDATQHSD